MQQRCAALWSPKSRNSKLTLTDNPAGCGLATMSRKISGHSDSPTDQWQKWKKMIGESCLWFQLLVCTGNLGCGGGWDRKKCINHITPEIMKSLRKTTPTSNVVRHRKSSSIDLFLVTENIIWDEGATQKRRGHDTIWVTKHELTGGKCGGGLSCARVLGNTIQ